MFEKLKQNVGDFFDFVDSPKSTEIGISFIFVCILLFAIVHFDDTLNSLVATSIISLGLAILFIISTIAKVRAKNLENTLSSLVFSLIFLILAIAYLIEHFE